MTRLHALITYSLLGSVWLAACGGDNKKSAPPYEPADGGEAGEAMHPGAGSPSAGAGNRSGAGGSEAAGEAGQANSAGAAGEAGAAGAENAAGAAGASEGGSSGSLSIGGQGGEGGQLICFNDLGQAGAPAEGIETGTDGSGSPLHVSYSCQAILDTLSPSYDLTTGNITLDVGSLGASAIADGTFTARYSYVVGNESYHEECVDGSVSVSGSKLTLPIEAPVQTPNQATTVWVTALNLHDQCGAEAQYVTRHPSDEDCINLRIYNIGEGGWQVDCYEDVCYPACGVILPNPAPSE